MQYDPFQKEAISHIDQDHSLLVSAPTGAGKTAIAEYVIDKAMREHKGAIYTAPIKALSNQKYRDFKEQYGQDYVGIITGDVTINPEAPILIMTTEIFRNKLFDEHNHFSEKSWVIYDEIHYIDDIERGTVWEESIMFFPKELKLLGLSATIPNINELASWIESILHRKICVVLEENRPVPLSHNFQCQGRIYQSINRLRREGYRMNLPKRKFISSKIHPNKILPLVKYINNHDGLPVIYFCFGRKRCREIAHEVSEFDFLDHHETHTIMRLFEELVKKYGLASEPSATDISYLVKKGIAFHHAGMLPTLKEVIERLFTSRLIKFICTTETFALGINMPARTVIFDELRKFYGTHFANLRTRDYYQMAGRAGRRGMDEKGYVYSRINPHRLEYSQLKKIIFHSPEPVKSQFSSSYATILNLYKQFGENLHKVYLKSFHCFQSKRSKHNLGFAQIRTKVEFLRSLGYIAKNKLTPKGEFASNIFGYELPLTEFYTSGLLHKLQEIDINIILSALVFEPRKNQNAPVLSPVLRNHKNRTSAIIDHIYKKEKMRQIRPKSKHLFFHLSEAIECWSKGGEFREALDATDTDEGEMIRYFRMVIQILREMYYIEGIDKEFKNKLANCLSIMNRGIVDAQKQLSV